MSIEDNSNIPVGVSGETQTAKKIYKNGSFKLDVYDWLHDIPQIHNNKHYAEVRFKSTRKDIYENVHSLSLEIGDIVAVEAASGHDVGIVSLVGELVYEQMK